MHTGLLWLDRNPHESLAESITRAAVFFQRKYGCSPSVCFVHPSQLEGQALPTGAIQVRPNRALRPGQIWLG